METDPHTQPLPLSPILDFSTDDFSGGLVAKDPSSSQAFLASTGRIGAPPQTQLAAVAGLCLGGERGAHGTGTRGGGEAGSEMHSAPAALIHTEPFFLSRRHLCAVTS